MVQVEKFLARYEALVPPTIGASREDVRERWTAEETETAEEFITHARAIRAERAAAAREGRDPKLVQILNQWGGVTLAYRRRLIDYAELHAQSRGGRAGAGGRDSIRRIVDAGGG